MFIDNAMPTRAPAMFPAMVHATDLRFAQLERGEIFWRSAFYKHLAPNRGKENNPTSSRMGK